MRTSTVDFATAFYDTTRTLSQLKRRFPFFFNASIPDSVWQEKRRDTLERALYRAVEKRQFPRYAPQLTELFKHVKYYFPHFKAPVTYWYVSRIDWQNPIFYRDSLLLVAGDLFLGADAPFYAGLPRYMRARFEGGQLIPRLALCLAKALVPPPRDRCFLSRMLYRGKCLMLAQAFVPTVSAYRLMGYTPAQWQWCLDNEFEVWNYFVSRDLLYDKDQALDARFLKQAPFSKFYLSIDNASPARIGSWIGWRIMQAYRAAQPRLSLTQCIWASDPLGLLRVAHYKPKP